MDDFLQNFKDEVNKNKSSDENPMAWEKFSEYRSLQDKSKRVIPGYLYWAAAAVVVLLFGSNAYWYNQNHNINSVATQVERDTIYITKYITSDNSVDQPDPINYANEIKASKIALKDAQSRIYALESTINAQYQNSKATRIKDNISPILNSDSEIANSKIELSDKKSSPKILIEKQDQQPELVIDKSIYITNLENTRLKPIDSTPRRFRAKPMFFSSSDTPTLLDYLKPKSFTVNGGIGYIGQIKEKLNYLQGSSFSLGINTLFTDRIRLSSAVSLGISSYEEQDPLNNASIPVVTIPEDSSLDDVNVNNYFITIQAGLDYLFKSKGMWRPYAGIGYAKIIDFKQEFRYQFKGALGSYFLDQENEGQRKFSDYLALRLGTDINYSRNIDGFLGLTYFQNLKKTGEVSFIISPGIYYHF